MNVPLPTRGHYYRPELDVLRFIAFALVFLYHSVPATSHPQLASLIPALTPVLLTFAASGRCGVSVFFVLSAFLLCELLLREKQATGSIQVGQFYIRRVARIWPLYYLILALGILFAMIPGNPPTGMKQIGWYAIFMAPMSVVHYGWAPNPIVPLWSISIEERLYLLIPWVLRFFNRRALLALSIALIAAANAWLFYLGTVRANDDSIWVDSIVQSQCFAAGILLSLSLNGRIPQLSKWTRGLLFAGGLLCFSLSVAGLRFATYHATYSGSWSLVGRYLIATIGATLILIAFLGIPQKLLPAWMIYLGRISFGLYAFQLFPRDFTNNFVTNPGINPVSFEFLRICFAFAATVALAALSFRFIESPFIRLRKRHAIIASQPE